MLYELRTYTLKPGGIGDMVKAASTVSRDIRGNDFGKLEGYWTTEIGPLNQVMHLWSYKDFAEREYIKFKLEKNNWNVSKTADDIDIQRSHLYSKIEKYGLKRND